eukprot:m.157172 g.157172  ORF g.157172 m.157172 type:complete len:200 (+) comp14332_c1_seq10:26-625(+)
MKYLTVYYVCVFTEMKEGINPFPVRFLSPQVLGEGLFTTKADIWSFGVLMWEAFTFGDKPYQNMMDTDVVQKVKLGYRMQLPEGCPDSFYSLMRQCWNMSTKSRPDFEDLLSSLLELREHYQATETAYGLQPAIRVDAISRASRMRRSRSQAVGLGEQDQALQRNAQRTHRRAQVVRQLGGIDTVRLTNAFVVTPKSFY